MKRLLIPAALLATYNFGGSYLYSDTWVYEASCHNAPNGIELRDCQDKVILSLRSELAQDIQASPFKDYLTQQVQSIKDDVDKEVSKQPIEGSIYPQLVLGVEVDRLGKAIQYVKYFPILPKPVVDVESAFNIGED